MSSVPEIPADVLAVDVAARSVAMRVDAKAYPLEAVYGASYLFLDRCWVLLDRPDDAHVRVTLAWKGEPADGALAGAVEEFAEELVSCAWRAGLAKETRGLIEGATAKAHSGAEMGAAPSLDDLASYDFAGEKKQQKETGPAPSNETVPEPPKEGA
jgi:His-Xaa-Ser system protein HxsD